MKEPIYMCWKCLTFHPVSALVICRDCKACKSNKKQGKRCLRKVCPFCEGGTFIKLE